MSQLHSYACNFCILLHRFTRRAHLFLSVSPVPVKFYRSGKVLPGKSSTIQYLNFGGLLKPVQRSNSPLRYKFTGTDETQYVIFNRTIHLNPISTKESSCNNFEFIRVKNCRPVDIGLVNSIFSNDQEMFLVIC